MRAHSLTTVAIIPAIRAERAMRFIASFATSIVIGLRERPIKGFSTSNPLYVEGPPSLTPRAPARAASG